LLFIYQNSSQERRAFWQDISVSLGSKKRFYHPSTTCKNSISLERKETMSKFKSARKAFTLVEIMIVVLIIGILLAIAVPNFVRARASSRQKADVSNLRQIDSAKEQYAMDNRKKQGDPVVMADIVGPSLYIKVEPKCPSTNGTLVPNNLGADPTCPNALAPDLTGIDHILNP
jgi:prepilin-type N-terminal cleavage/methylation domain-containing protein